MKILFLGDLLLDYDYIPPDFERICDYVKENGYKVILNLETSISGFDTPIKKRGVNLACSQVIITALKQLNVVAVNLANNHTMDYGPEALKKMCQLLDNAGIGYFGAGCNTEQAEKPFVLHEEGYRIIFQGYGWDVEETVYATDSASGCAALNPRKILDNIKTVKMQYPDSLLVNVFHWGFEYNTLPMPRDIQLAHDAVDAGCHLIIGHHPHVVQPKERWKGKNIYYSLGNFYFGSRRKRFKRVFSHDQVPNMCDYGVGIVWNVDSDEYDHFVIKYTSDRDSSDIIQDQVFDLEDITSVDYLGNEYKRNVKRRKLNYNPILGVDEQKNRRLIETLYRKYGMIACLQRLKKINIGLKFYRLCKKILVK